ncbi:MAG: HTH domain-containing protein [Cyclobacteriaceae bacterium]
MEALQARVRNLLKSRRELKEKFVQSISLDPFEMAVTSMDQRFIQRLLKVMEMEISDTALSVDKLSREMGMSRGTLHRKIKALTDQSVS